MRTGEAAKQAIGTFEGLELKAYRCPSGILTIGYGHTKGVYEGMQITKEKALCFLGEDLAEVERNINFRFPLISQNKFDAFVSLSFNIGTQAFNTSTLYRKAKVNLNDPSIRAEFLKWVHSKGRVLPGLVNRRTWEANLYFS